MKTYYYEDGREIYSTMTVGELRAKLAEFPEDMPVLATWESVRTPFLADSFQIGGAPDKSAALIIDVDQW